MGFEHLSDDIESMLFHWTAYADQELDALLRGGWKIREVVPLQSPHLHVESSDIQNIKRKIQGQALVILDRWKPASPT